MKSGPRKREFVLPEDHLKGKQPFRSCYRQFESPTARRRAILDRHPHARMREPIN